MKNSVLKNYFIYFFLVSILASAAPFRPANIKIPLHAPDVSQVTFKNAFPALKFSRPVFMTMAPDKSGRLFVVEQTGLIRVFPNISTTTTAQIFVDPKNIIAYDGNEMGLLGLAF